VVLRQPRFEELAFQFDTLLKEARLAQEDGNWAGAAGMFEYIANRHQNELWMKGLAANAFFKAGAHSRAAELSGEVNHRRPVVDTLLLEAKVERERKAFSSAVELLERAEEILEGNELLWK
jgi:hypothetical protein